MDGSRFLLCLKATSKTTLYETNKEVMAGCVYYKAEEIQFFGVNTAIQPDNIHPIPHSHLTTCDQEGTLEVLGIMPQDFADKLRHAVKASIRMNVKRKENLLAHIGNEK